MLIGTDEGIIGSFAQDVRGPVACLARHGETVAAVVEGGRAVAIGEAIVPVPSDDSATCVALMPGGRALVGTAGAHLLRFADGSLTLVRSFDEAPGRDGWYTPWGGPPDVRSIAVTARGASGPPISNGVIYVNVHVGGIVVATDDEGSWRPTIDVDADVHQVVLDERRLLAATAIGLAVSDDGGATWSFEADGLHAPYCRAVAVSDAAILLSASEGPGGGRAAVYRRTGDGPFERCTDWLKGNIDTFCLVADGADGALGTEEGEVFVSGDGGRSWERTASGLPPVRCLLL